MNDERQKASQSMRVGWCMGAAMRLVKGEPDTKTWHEALIRAGELIEADEVSKQVDDVGIAATLHNAVAALLYHPGRPR